MMQPIIVIITPKEQLESIAEELRREKAGIIIVDSVELKIQPIPRIGKDYIITAFSIQHSRDVKVYIEGAFFTGEKLYRVVGESEHQIFILSDEKRKSFLLLQTSKIHSNGTNILLIEEAYKVENQDIYNINGQPLTEEDYGKPIFNLLIKSHRKCTRQTST